MITWIYLFGVLVTFFLLMLKISANNMQAEFTDKSSKLAIFIMSMGSWFSVFWLFFVDEYEL